VRLNFQMNLYGLGVTVFKSYINFVLVFRYPPPCQVEYIPTCCGPKF
jgi:hypothetical protein